MGALWLRALAEIRSRWRVLLSAALLCGFFGAAVLALVAGARRTETAYPRFLERQRAFDVLISDSSLFLDVFWKPDFDRLARFPYVESAVRVELGGFDEEQPDFPPGGLFIGSEDPRFGHTINRAFVVEGKLPDPARPDEIAVPYFADGLLGRFRVGDRKTLMIGDKAVSLTVVGRTAMPGELPPQPQFGWQVLVTPAFLDRYRSEIQFLLPGMMIRFDRRSDVARLEGDVLPLTGGKVFAPQEQESHARAVAGSTDLQSSALRLLALFTAFTGAIILGQLLARETAVGAEDASSLRAIGMSRRQLFRLGILRVIPVAVIGAIVAVLIAWLASTIFPRGSVRAIEPTNGPLFDASVLGLGGIAVALAVMILVLVPAWRAAVKAGRPVPAAARPSAIAAFVAAVGMSVPAVAGARFALERGRGRTAIPVVSSMTVVALGIAAFVASTTFSDSLQVMIDQPALHGKVWDEVLNTSDFEAPPEQQAEEAARTGVALAKDPDIVALAAADSGIPLRVFPPTASSRGIAVLGIAIQNLKGSMFSPIVKGREPRAADEVVLGARMIRALGLEFDPAHPPTVRLALQGGTRARVKLRVVGQGVIPPLGNFGELGYGVMLGSEDALLPLLAEGVPNPPVTDLVVRWRPGADPKAVIARHKKEFPHLAFGEDIAGGRFADAVNFGGVQGAPIAVGGVLAALGAAALAHVLVTAIRRRRRDIAILKTIGFVRGQARRVVAWQATFTVLVATAVGVPLGVMGGRWLWGRVARNIGVLPRPEVGTLLLVLLLPVVVVLANLLAAFPARSAARTKPAIVLRSE